MRWLFCKLGCPQTTCDQSCRRWHCHNSGTNYRRERNNCELQNFLWYRTWDKRIWFPWLWVVQPLLQSTGRHCDTHTEISRTYVDAPDTPCKLLLQSNVPLQAWAPSNQVCSNFESPGSPQFWNQLPSRAQQLRTPDGFFNVPHFWQMELISVVVARATVPVIGQVALIKCFT